MKVEFMVMFCEERYFRKEIVVLQRKNRTNNPHCRWGDLCQMSGRLCRNPRGHCRVAEHSLQTERRNKRNYGGSHWFLFAISVEIGLGHYHS